MVLNNCKKCDCPEIRVNKWRDHTVPIGQNRYACECTQCKYATKPCYSTDGAYQEWNKINPKSILGLKILNCNCGGEALKVPRTEFSKIFSAIVCQKCGKRTAWSDDPEFITQLWDERNYKSNLVLKNLDKRLTKLEQRIELAIKQNQMSELRSFTKGKFNAQDGSNQEVVD